MPAIGTTESVNSITLDDVKDYFKNFSGFNAVLAITGDIEKNTVIKKLDFLTKLTSNNTMPQARYQLPSIDKTKIYFVDKKDAPQSEIRVGYLALPFDATGEYFKSSIMNYPLAQAFNSRINFILREVKGFTYGARGYFTGSQFVGPYVLFAGVKANTTDSSVVIIMDELKKYHDNGITDEELSFTKNAMAQSEALKYESPHQKLGFIKRVVDYNLDKNYTNQQAEIIKNITKDEINELAKKNIPYDKMIILVVGDKASNYEKLSKLGYEIIELDVNGNKIK